MQRVYTDELPPHAGARVALAGWVHRVRDLSRVTFLVLRDAHGLAQVVAGDRSVGARIAALTPESVVRVEGVATPNEQAPGAIELRADALDVLSDAASPLPVDLFRPKLNAQLPAILDHAAITLRHPRQRAYWQIAAAAMHGFRSTMRALEFTEIQTPKIVASATEGGANVFAVDYMGRPAYLAQSPQFYKQMMVGVFERVFEVGPVFRAEPHDTTRHLNEYVSLDAEIGFIEDHKAVMAILTRVMSGMLDAVASDAANALSLLDLALPEVPSDIPSLHFRDAMQLIYERTGEDAREEPDLSPAHERWLGEWARHEHGSDVLFVVGYPLAKRPFYTHPDPQRPRYSNSFDLLFRGVELVTGGQRLHRYGDYRDALAARNVDPAPFEGYLQAFRYGMPPHGGFAIGLERFVAQITGVANVREVTLFPRDLHRLTP